MHASITHPYSKMAPTFPNDTSAFLDRPFWIVVICLLLLLSRIAIRRWSQYKRNRRGSGLHVIPFVSAPWSPPLLESVPVLGSHSHDRGDPLKVHSYRFKYLEKRDTVQNSVNRVVMVMLLDPSVDARNKMVGAIRAVSHEWVNMSNFHNYLSPAFAENACLNPTNNIAFTYSINTTYVGVIVGSYERHSSHPGVLLVKLDCVFCVRGRGHELMPFLFNQVRELLRDINAWSSQAASSRQAPFNTILYQLEAIDEEYVIKFYQNHRFSLDPQLDRDGLKGMSLEVN